MDMLVKLYAVEGDPEIDRRLTQAETVIRRALPPEMQAIADWIAPRFGEGWVSEMRVAMTRQPVSCLIAVHRGRLAGFACYDATARGFFGPTGVDETMRGKGIGHALLVRTLLAMADYGYGYAVIGGAGPTGFYRRSVGALEVEGSETGIYRGMLDLARPKEVSTDDGRASAVF